MPAAPTSNIYFGKYLRIGGLRIHLLRKGDVYQQDKMNYDAVERLCSENARSLLKEHVPGI